MRDGSSKERRTRADPLVAPTRGAVRVGRTARGSRANCSHSRLARLSFLDSTRLDAARDRVACRARAGWGGSAVELRHCAWLSATQNEKGATSELDSLCVLDFFVHESCRRRGCESRESALAVGANRDRARSRSRAIARRARAIAPRARGRGREDSDGSAKPRDGNAKRSDGSGGATAVPS